MTLFVDQASVIVSPHLEAVLLHVLSVVQDALDGSAVWLVAHVDGESSIVIQLWVLVDEQLGDELAENRDVRAEERCDTRSEPVGTKKLVDAE